MKKVRVKLAFWHHRVGETLHMPGLQADWMRARGYIDFVEDEPEEAEPEPAVPEPKPEPVKRKRGRTRKKAAS